MRTNAQLYAVSAQRISLLEGLKQNELSVLSYSQNLCDLVLQKYRGADKSLARTGRKQANVSVRVAWISFGALPCRGKKRNLMTAHVSMLKSRASLTFFRACILPGRAKDFSAPRFVYSTAYFIIDWLTYSHSWTTRFGWSNHHQVNQNLSFFVVCNSCNLATTKCAINGTLLHNFQFSARLRTQAVKVANRSVIEWDTEIVRLRYSVHASTQ